MPDFFSSIFPIEFLLVGGIVLAIAYFAKKDLIFWGAMYVAIYMFFTAVSEARYGEPAPIVFWAVLGLAFLAVAIYRQGRVPRAPAFVSVSSKTELLSAVQTHAAQGYSTVMDRGNVIVMNRKIPFNWLLCIVLLFVPVIGWIALLVLLFANKNKVSTVTIEAPETAGV